MDTKTFQSQETIIPLLGKIYEKHGYKKYKMNKFEEYDLYLENKSFLKSDRIITFNDLNGKLLALKPDVTLSIVKNSEEDEQKLYYSENVYRVKSGQYKEIMQVGLEYIGNADIFTYCEVLSLAAESLGAISDDFLLDVSHLGFISGLTQNTDEAFRGKIAALISAKDTHEIKLLCAKNNIDDETSEKLCILSGLCGKFEDVLPKCKDLITNEETQKAFDCLEKISSVLSAMGKLDKIRLDFSVINDMNYYNGIVFSGFVNGIPQSVLSGGCYDKLLKKFGKSKNAIGFAVYMDTLEYYSASGNEFDADVFLCYDENADPIKLSKAIDMLISGGQTVFAAKKAPKNMKYRQLLKFSERGLEFND